MSIVGALAEGRAVMHAVARRCPIGIPWGPANQVRGKEKPDANDYDERWRARLLQGLGRRSTGGFQSRLATQRGRMEGPNAPSCRPRLPLYRPRPSWPWPLPPALERQRNGLRTAGVSPACAPSLRIKSPTGKGEVP